MSRTTRPVVFVIAAILVASFAPLPARGAVLPFRQYRNADGLPQSQVLSLLQDRRGEIWVGTYCGAARFDGAVFRPLTTREGLPANYVWDLAEDPKSGDLWMAVGQGVARVAPTDLGRPAESWNPIVASPHPSAVRQILFDRGGTLWAVLRGGGLARREGAGFRLLPGPSVDTDSSRLLVEGDGGELLLGTEEGIFRLAPGAARLERWRAAAGPWNEPISLLRRVTPGELWFSTTKGVFRLAGDSIEELKDAEGRSLPIARALHLDRKGRLWIASDAGLWRRGPDGLLRIGVADGLAAERLYSILEDREGNLWFGTDNGLSKFPGDLFRAFLAADGLADESVWSLASDLSGRLLAGTRSGVFVFDGSRFAPLATPNPLTGKMVRSILDDGTGSLWFGTARDGLFRFDGRLWTQFRPPDLPDHRIYGSFRDRTGALWFTTQGGLARWRDGKFDRWDRTNGLPDDTAWMIREDPAGRIVVSTDGGLARLDGERFVVPPELEGFRGTAVRCFAYRKDGSLWIGTNGRGLARFDGRQWKELGAGDGPSDNFVWGIVVDREDRLWVATNHGIDLFDGHRWTNVSARDGMLSDEIAVNSAAEASDGSVWFGFGGAVGAIRFDGSAVSAPAAPPILRVTSVRAGRRPAVPEPTRLIVPWGDRDLTFQYVGVSFRDERTVAYRTKLEGYDRDWSAPTGERSARYTNLEPKRYRFLVESRVPGGDWTSQPASVEVVVLPPFWRTWWFQLLAVIGSGLVLFSLVAWRLGRVVREKARLEETVRERTRSLEEKMQLVAELKEKYEKLSTTDPLTGIANRRAFLERIEEEIERARRHGEAMGLVLIDLDHFKAVNDRFGHATGDEVLGRFARLLEEHVRSYDLVARFGGEEFVLAYLHSDRSGALERTEQLRRAVEAMAWSADGEQVRVTMSAGFVWHEFAPGGASVLFDDLARDADRALYRAKRAGRNRVEVATPDDRAGDTPPPRAPESPAA